MKKMVHKHSSKKEIHKPKEDMSAFKTAKDSDIAMDFANKVYKKMDKIIKSIVLFGSSAKGNSNPKSDIDIMIILDDATIQWDDELVAWYREELAKIVKSNPYPKALHVNTVRLTTWWSEMIRGEPAVLNVIRWGVPLIDFGGFFMPLKSLMIQGKLKGSPEMIFITLGRAPAHMARAKSNLLSAMEALYWAFVDSSHAALIAAKQSPPSPEHIPALLRDALVQRNLLDKKYVEWYKEVYMTTHRLLRGESLDISGKEVQMWRERADEYIRAMAIVVKKVTGML